jgi:hypothetical protein
VSLPSASPFWRLQGGTPSVHPRPEDRLVQMLTQSESVELPASILAAGPKGVPTESTLN